MNEERIATGASALAMTRTPEIIAGEIRTFTASMLNNIIEIGRRMVEAKELLPYGEFGKWIREATGYSTSTANNFMRLYQEYGADQGSLFGAEVDCQTFGKLSYSKALALLTVPKEEREEVALELDAEHLSTRELEKALAERDEARKQAEAAMEERGFWEDKATATAQELDKALTERDEARRAVEDAGPYKEKLAEAEGRVKELESRPVEVAVERDEKAIQEAAAEGWKKASAEAKAELDRLRDKLNKAQKAKEKAEAEAKRAVEDAGPYKEKLEAEAERARQEAEELRRKLHAAESGAGEVAMLARMAQTNFLAAVEKIQAMKGAHPDTAEKMLGGMEQIVKMLSGKIDEVRG